MGSQVDDCPVELCHKGKFEAAQTEATAQRVRHSGTTGFAIMIQMKARQLGSFMPRATRTLVDALAWSLCRIARTFEKVRQRMLRDTGHCNHKRFGKLAHFAIRQGQTERH
jgi:hypothetical protein